MYPQTTMSSTAVSRSGTMQADAMFHQMGESTRVVTYIWSLGLAWGGSKWRARATSKNPTKLCRPRQTHNPQPTLDAPSAEAMQAPQSGEASKHNKVGRGIEVSTSSTSGNISVGGGSNKTPPALRGPCSAGPSAGPAAAREQLYHAGPKCSQGGKRLSLHGVDGQGEGTRPPGPVRGCPLLRDKHSQVILGRCKSPNKQQPLSNEKSHTLFTATVRVCLPCPGKSTGARPKRELKRAFSDATCVPSNPIQQTPSQRARGLLNLGEGAHGAQARWRPMIPYHSLALLQGARLDRGWWLRWIVAKHCRCGCLSASQALLRSPPSMQMSDARVADRVTEQDGDTIPPPI
ncbi:hypothetical protein B0T17DRAFT_625112 [Bombardia bombarda]|uniref:Uncharacterized protein n=1 Tax=Bombardia bombarda TaxID=252184 RepID=A0AA40CFU9_9PEZI|nr:hypothetical protein B0T17DRAFT_625112 [Bombardia bombarda]